MSQTSTGYITSIGGLGASLLQSPKTQSIYNYPVDTPPKSGIQYELDSLRGQVSLLQDAVAALDNKLAPVSFPRPGLGKTSATAPKPTGSVIADVLSQVRDDISDITNSIYATRDALDI